MDIHNRLTTVADCFTLAEEYPDYEDAWLTMADEIYYLQPCINGEIDWRNGYSHQPEAEALDGYVVPWNPDDKPRLRDVAFCLACIGGAVAWLWGLAALINWRTS